MSSGVMSSSTIIAISWPSAWALRIVTTCERIAPSSALLMVSGSLVSSEMYFMAFAKCVGPSNFQVNVSWEPSMPGLRRKSHNDPKSRSIRSRRPDEFICASVSLMKYGPMSKDYHTIGCQAPVDGFKEEKRHYARICLRVNESSGSSVERWDPYP